MISLDTTKSIARFVTGVGAAGITAQVIRTNTCPTNVAEKVTFTAATFVASDMAGVAVASYTDRAIDNIVAVYKKITNSEK